MKVYKMYLNGKFYGSGSLEYMHELFKDYAITMRMYGRGCVTVVIKECKKSIGK